MPCVAMSKVGFQDELIRDTGCVAWEGVYEGVRYDLVNMDVVVVREGVNCAGVNSGDQSPGDPMSSIAFSSEVSFQMVNVSVERSSNEISATDIRRRCLGQSKIEQMVSETSQGHSVASVHFQTGIRKELVGF